MPFRMVCLRVIPAAWPAPGYLLKFTQQLSLTSIEFSRHLHENAYKLIAPAASVEILNAPAAQLEDRAGLSAL